MKMLKAGLKPADTRSVRPAPKFVDPHYSRAEHRRWREIILQRAGGRCQDPGCKDPSRGARLFADHIVELRDGGDPYDLNNGLARCGSCHTRKTLRLRGERARRRETA
jgi:hypothetical protein